MGKKIKSLMDEMSVKFVEGAGRKKISSKKARDIFALIEKFAQYGFNKSHSVAYAYIAYQTAWLKEHYPAEFLSANLTSEMTTTDRVVILINECRKFGIEVNLPDINVSNVHFRPVGEKSISYGLNAIKNVGLKALEKIIEDRDENGPFDSIFDLCARVEQRTVNKKVLESLVLAGAMDNFEGARAQMYQAVDDAIRYGQQMQNGRDQNQVDMFGNADGQSDLIRTPNLPDVAEWEEQDTLAKEKEVLGLYLTGHPLLEHAEDLEEFSNADFESEMTLSKNDVITVGGLITSITRRYDRRNNPMAFFSLDCLGGRAEIVAFSECYRKYEDLVEDGKVVFVKGKPSDNSDFSDFKMLADEIIPIDRVRDLLSTRLNIRFDSGFSNAESVEQVYSLAHRFPGKCGVIFHLPNGNGHKPTRVLVHNIKVSTEREFLRQLRDIYGKDNIWIE